MIVVLALIGMAFSAVLGYREGYRWGHFDGYANGRTRECLGDDYRGPDCFGENP